RTRSGDALKRGDLLVELTPDLPGVYLLEVRLNRGESGSHWTVLPCDGGLLLVLFEQLSQCVLTLLAGELCERLALPSRDTATCSGESRGCVVRARCRSNTVDEAEVFLRHLFQRADVLRSRGRVLEVTVVDLSLVVLGQLGVSLLEGVELLSNFLLGLGLELLHLELLLLCLKELLLLLELTLKLSELLVSLGEIFVVLGVVDDLLNLGVRLRETSVLLQEIVERGVDLLGLVIQLTEKTEALSDLFGRDALVLESLPRLVLRVRLGNTAVESFFDLLEIGEDGLELDSEGLPDRLEDGVVPTLVLRRLFGSLLNFRAVLLALVYDLCLGVLAHLFGVHLYPFCCTRTIRALAACELL